jgi:hypothetical protein
MEPDRTLEIKLCSKCGSTHFVLDYFYKAKATNEFTFLWELEGFFIRPRCGDCGNTPKFRYFDKVELAIIFWNEGF